MKFSLAFVAIAAFVAPVLAAPEPLLAGNAGDLEVRTCKKVGAPCKLNEQCCSDSCKIGTGGNGKCRPASDEDVEAREALEARTCKKVGATCKLNEQCCSNSCKIGTGGNGKCRPASDEDVEAREEVEAESLEARTCKKVGATCKLNEQCCSNSCKIGTGGNGKCRPASDEDVEAREEVEAEFLEARTCKVKGDPCKLNEQCCSGSCKVGTAGNAKCR